MKLSNNTILITGGSSGIGLELSRILLGQKNTVIICGRSKTKLQKTKEQLPEIITFQCDISESSQCKNLSDWIKNNFPDLNVLINNAAMVHKTDFTEVPDSINQATLETETNFLGPVRLTKHLLPTLKQNPNPAVINITTGLIFAPRKAYPFYTATKAALHTFTLVLRLQLKNMGIKIIEAQFPAVDTPWHNGNPPKIAISPEKAVAEMMKGLKAGKEEIRIGGVKKLYALSRIAPKFAIKVLNHLAEG
jgi:uncharacterized oxidoreductase